MSASSREILAELKALLTHRFGEEVKQVTLFGSQSQGMATEDSDYDILVVLQHDYDWRKEKEIINACYYLDLKYDILTDVKVISLNELHSPKGQQPYIVNALQKGVSI